MKRLLPTCPGARVGINKQTAVVVSAFAYKNRRSTISQLPDIDPLGGVRLFFRTIRKPSEPDDDRIEVAYILYEVQHDRPKLMIDIGPPENCIQFLLPAGPLQPDNLCLFGTLQDGNRL